MVSQTSYNYDETTPTPTSGITQHTSVTGSRGNLTSIHYPLSGLTANFTYYDTGLTSETNPESGTVTYGYNSNGDLITRTAPAPNQTGSATVVTCFGTLSGTSCDGSGYDLLHRPQKKSYSDGTTPTAFFSWDGSGRWGVTQTNTTGR